MQPSLIFKALLGCILTVSFKLFREISASHVFPCKESNESFCPHFVDLTTSFSYAVGFVLLYFLFSCLTIPLGRYLIISRKSDSSSPKHQKQISIKVERFSYHLCRFLYFLSVCLWAFNILQPEPYFPGELGGVYIPSSTHAYIETYLLDSHLHLTPRSLEFILWYFRSALGFQLASAFLVFRNPCLSDVPEPSVQFTLNSALIVLGYMANHLFLGSCLLLLHDSCDILTSWCQALVNTRYKTTTFLSAVCLIVAFAYMRLFCFGKLFLLPIVYVIESKNLYIKESSNLIYFGVLLLCLFLMNIYWFSLLVKSCFVYAMYGRMTTHVVS